jgi:hypothetical protein
VITLTHKDEKFEENMNSPENKELTQRQAEAASNPEEGKKSDMEAVQNVAEAADHEKKLSAEQQAQKENATHEGHLTPNRLNFNQYDNTAEQYDKAKGTPADPDLRDSTEGLITDREGTVVDTGYDAMSGEQADTQNPPNENYSTGEPEEEEEKKVRTQDKRNSDK